MWRKRLGSNITYALRRLVPKRAKSFLRSRFVSVLLSPQVAALFAPSGEMTAAHRRANERERQLFGGFSSHALTLLELAHRDPNTDLDEFVATSHTLWRWHRMHGEHELALRILKALARRDPQTAATYNFQLLNLPTMIDAGLPSAAIEAGVAAIAQFGASTEIEMSLAWAHLALGDEAGALDWLNRTFERKGLAKLRKQDAGRPLSLANLAADAKTWPTECKDKLSVIIPAHNCVSTLSYALPSVQQQTWTNLEIIVVDDCSSDDTWRVVQDFAASDERVVPLRNEINRGAYCCRNRGLQRATGDLVTVHDSDDWSHPEKFATQIAHLSAKGNLCNVSMRTRVTPNLHKGLAARPAAMEIDFPSLLLRKETLAALGGWDEVRVAADRELFNRLALAFRERPDRIYDDVPLAFGLVDPLSLTGNPFTGFATLGYGARKEYQEAHRSWHQIEAAKAEPDFRLPRNPRPFPVPNIIKPERHKKLSYGMILVSDFSSRNCRDINLRILSANSFAERGAIMHWPRITNAQRAFDPAIRKALIRFSIPTLVYGDKAVCKAVLVTEPECLLHVPDQLAQIAADEGIILVKDGDKSRIEANFAEVFSLQPRYIKRGLFTRGSSVLNSLRLLGHL